MADINRQLLIDKFLNILSSRSVLEEIDNSFIDANITRNRNVEPKYSGQRKSLAWEYISTLNIENDVDFQKLLKVIEFYLTRWQIEFDNWDDDEEIKRLIKVIKLTGFDYKKDLGLVNSGGAKISLTNIKELAKKNDLNYILKECERIEKEAETDPEDAITSAKAMVESSLKHILDSEGEGYKNNEGLRDLYKKVSQIMNLSPGGHNELMFKTILSGMINVINGLDEIRNEYGDAHGKSVKNYKPETRHAILAVNAAKAIIEFLLSTYDHKKK